MSIKHVTMAATAVDGRAGELSLAARYLLLRMAMDSGPPVVRRPAGGEFGMTHGQLDAAVDELAQAGLVAPVRFDAFADEFVGNAAGDWLMLFDEPRVTEVVARRIGISPNPDGRA
ncbi:hypothetical protein [Patulibacter defluvii]|uniref:hypothetical protein n=1 Tax=Patulibacter defluvii TaxID=3095358 RepID=UPI002A7524D5|nr:hypothetical protein [Patulibacter sp. DM4]